MRETLAVPDPASLVPRLEATLRAAGSPERAVQERRYLKSDLEFAGVGLPAVRRVAQGVLREHPGLDGDACAELARLLWREPLFERRLLAVLLLVAAVDRLTVAHLDVCENLLRDSRTWALVDAMAADVVGPVVEAAGTDRPRADALLDAWAADGDFWIRRSALLAPLRALKAGGGDWPRFARHADAMLEEKEFFVRKAIGWVLRETGKQRPDLVHAWLLPRASRAAGLTVREAVKYLGEDQREEILGAR